MRAESRLVEAEIEGPVVASGLGRGLGGDGAGGLWTRGRKRFSRGIRAPADHALPGGSGTVARTQRIPIEQRAEAATIVWMRHQTAAYDKMAIPREKGKRREVRRMLAKKSKQLLDRYRRAGEVRVGECPLGRAPGVA